VGGRRQSTFAGKTAEQTFSEIYANNVWGGTRGEYFSGRGSRGLPAENYAAAVRKFIAEHHVRRVVDLGCGDFQVASMFVNQAVHYTGCDVVLELVGHLNRTHGRDTVEFVCVNIIEDELPASDLCLVRQVLQHLSNAEIARILHKCTQYKFLIVTEHYPNPGAVLVPNLDIPHGPEMRLHFDSAVVLDKPPFTVKNVELLTETEADDGTLIKTFLIRRRD